MVKNVNFLCILIYMKIVSNFNGMFEYFFYIFAKDEDILLIESNDSIPLNIQTEMWNKYHSQFYYFFINYMYQKSQKANQQIFLIQFVKNFRGESLTTESLFHNFKETISVNAFKNKLKKISTEIYEENLEIKSCKFILWFDNFVKIYFKKYAKKEDINSNLYLTGVTTQKITSKVPIFFKEIDKLNEINEIMSFSNVIKIRDNLLETFKNLKGLSKNNFSVEIHLSKIKDKPFDMLNKNISKKTVFIEIVKILKEKFKDSKYFIPIKADIAVATWFWKIQFISEKDLKLNQFVMTLGLWHNNNILSEAIFKKYLFSFFGRLIFASNKNLTMTAIKPKYQIRLHFFKVLYVTFKGKINLCILIYNK